MKTFTKKNFANNSEKRLIAPILAITLALLLGGGAIIAAFFSDIIKDSGDVTTGTLDLTGQYTFYMNGSTESATGITNFNPGDVIVIKATVSNAGNKSAWVRDGITVTADAAFIPFLDVYAGEKTAAAITVNPEADKLTMADNTVYTATRVLNGSGEGAEIEEDDRYDLIDAASYNVAFTLYFRTDADNSAQGKSLNFIAFTQGLQFRNNSGSEPNDTAWGTVTTEAFGA